ncbi:hypothetical protein NQ315_010379 [Exocentrus adspersus]|uniref:OSK domain-containing protein n=1 Tax=Exocentrus adspersus TaxID=1586481 RepID=A0AAV8WC90_9CUCU|nr:hypothetical protein NQ315_010379 [Exocentrus adspersus]
MVLGNQDLLSEEKEITKILISIICLYGKDGLPLEKVSEEFQSYCGFTIPYEKFGAENLRSWILTLPDIYLLLDSQNNEVLIQQSQKSTHIKELILKQKSHRRYQLKRKNDNNYFHRDSKRRRESGLYNLPQGSFIHNSINKTSVNDSNRFNKFEQLECMLPLLYKHQALGDDFFVDIADTKLGYYIPENGPKECGLCAAGQTILDLTKKVQNAVYLAPRVVVMIGFQDLLCGRNVNNMICDLRQLVIELKRRNTRVTIITLIPSPKLPTLKRLKMRMDIYNRAILDYACDTELKCNVIDMNAIFLNEEENFRKDYDRLSRLAKKDQYKVFSDYGRKIFLSTLKCCLREQIEVGH